MGSDAQLEPLAESNGVVMTHIPSKLGQADLGFGL